MLPLVVAALAACLTAAEKKPVTLEAVSKQTPSAGIHPVWSPDGNRFAWQDRTSVKLYEVATRQERTIVLLSALNTAATKVPEFPVFAWENRNVSERNLQWTPDGKDLLVSAGGDVFRVRLSAGGWVQLTATPIAERDAKLSPDGTRLAYRHNHDLYVVELASHKTTRLTMDGSPTLLNGELDWVYPEELELGTAYWWSPDSQSIAYLQLDTSRELIYPHVDLLGLLARPEPQRYPKAGTPNADPRLGVVRASGGRTQWMDLGEMRDRLLARVYWRPDSRQIAAFRLNRVQNELHVFGADPATGQARVLFHEKDPFWINLDEDFFYLPKSSRILRGSDRDGHRHLYLHDYDGKLLSQLTRGDWDVTSVLHVDEGGGRVWIESTQASPLERQVYSVSLDGGEPRRLTQAKGTHAASISPTGEYWVDAYSSIDSPTQITLRDAAGGAIATIRPPDRQMLEQYQIAPTELLSFKGNDGTLYYARLIKPVNFEAAKKYPAVVMIYGGPHAQTVRDMWTGMNWEQVLAHRGFVIWQMDNRGSGGRGHTWESKINRHFGKQELADQLEGVKYLTSLGFVDPSRIGITGWSYGGYMTLTAMLHAPGTFKAGISGAPVTDWRLYDTIYTERYMGLPSENPEGYKDSSPVHFAKQLKGRLMLVHNYGDDNVLYQNNLLMQVELQRAGKQYDLLVYPQKAHGVTGPLNAHLREAMIAFFERELKP